jgi:hypothetical protein
MAHIAEDDPATGAHVTFHSGFFWAIETASGEPFNDAQVSALASAFRLVGPPHARVMDQPLLALAFAQIADFFRRTWPDLLRTNGCLFPLPPLALPSGALGYAYLAAWPALLAELERHGVWATGPVLDARAAPATPRSRRGGSAVLRCRLLFDPARVGPSSGHTWLERPWPGMLALGEPASVPLKLLLGAAGTRRRWASASRCTRVARGAGRGGVRSGRHRAGRSSRRRARCTGGRS